MKYLRIVFSVVLVVSLGYLYSCSLDNPTKPGSTVSQMTDGSVQSHAECPDMPGHLGTHFCISLWLDGVDITGASTTGFEVKVTGRDTTTNEIVYTCSYSAGPGAPNATALGSRLPYGLNITRSICYNGTPYGKLAGTEQFNSSSHGVLQINLHVVPNTSLECFDASGED
jgi:hypothetical protein